MLLVIGLLQFLCMVSAGPCKNMGRCGYTELHIGTREPIYAAPICYPCPDGQECAEFKINPLFNYVKDYKCMYGFRLVGRRLLREVVYELSETNKMTP